MLLINLGTPLHCDLSSVRCYLKEFLMDPRVLTMPYWARFLLVYGFILPFRSSKTQKAYQKIWTAPDDSPLRVNSLVLKKALAQQLGSDYNVSLGMRYGQPSIAAALKALQNCESITIFPLFPQYASASTGSALQKTLSILSCYTQISHLQVIRDFYQASFYSNAYAQHIKNYLKNEKNKQSTENKQSKANQNQSNVHEAIDCFVFSYHALPVRHNRLESKPYLSYKSQCEQTSDLIVQALARQLTDTPTLVRGKLEPQQLFAQTFSFTNNHYYTCFQSRLGWQPWIQPYTDQLLPALYRKGFKNIVITCPSFVCDCLETLEEINIRARAQWQSLGGKKFIWIPALNSDPFWVKALAQWLRG